MTPAKRIKTSPTIKEPSSQPQTSPPVKPSFDEDKENHIQNANHDGAHNAASETPTEPSSTITPKKSPYRSTGGYDALKTFNGQVYSGMAVGGSHIWNYDPGVWKETKEEPDLWKIDYETIKRRAKNAPDGSGAAVGTEYHWLIVAHQYVRKTSANTYETHLTGSKYKLAHKMSSSASWSVPTVKGQRDRELELLDDAKRRIQGLPPVLAGEKVKVETREKGQVKLDSLFAKSPAKKTNGASNVRPVSPVSPVSVRSRTGAEKRKADQLDDGNGDEG